MFDGKSCADILKHLWLLPNFGALVPEELQELGDEDVERSVDSIAVQDLRIVFTDLLQRSKRSLHQHFVLNTLSVNLPDCICIILL